MLRNAKNHLNKTQKLELCHFMPKFAICPLTRSFFNLRKWVFRNGTHIQTDRQTDRRTSQLFDWIGLGADSVKIACDSTTYNSIKHYATDNATYRLNWPCGRFINKLGYGPVFVFLTRKLLKGWKLNYWLNGEEDPMYNTGEETGIFLFVCCSFLKYNIKLILTPIT